MPVITGLPRNWEGIDGGTVDLSIVPPSPSGPDDPDRPAKVEQWVAWAREVERFRIGRWKACDGLLADFNADREREIEYVRCRQSPAYFITVWCWIHETRPDQLDSYPWYQAQHGGWLPAILYPFQYDLLEWLQRRLDGRGSAANGCISKSRDMGATWVCILWALYHFLFSNPFSAKLISRREDLVDQPLNLDSMMERIAAHLDDADGNAPLPHFLTPEGWEAQQNRQRLKITRPGDRNIIAGESTSSRSGRGGRSSVAIVDEAAFIDVLKLLLSAIQNTASHVILLSSESVEAGEAFVEIQNEMKAQHPDSVLELDWWLHPMHDKQWLEDMRARYAGDEEGFAREVLRDPYAGFGGWLYPTSHDITPLANDREWVSGCHLYVGIDPGWDDETAIHWVMVDQVGGRDTLLTSFESSHLPPEYYAAIILGVDPDTLPQYTFPERVRELMEWTRTLPAAYVCGDPYGRNRTADKSDSWYERMLRFSLEHNPKKNPDTGKGAPLLVRTSYKMDDRSFQGRRMALMNWLPRIDFNANQEAQRTLYAIQRSRYENSERRSSEQKQPLHDNLSHRRTALEFIAVHREDRLMHTGRNTVYASDKGSRSIGRSKRAAR